MSLPPCFVFAWFRSDVFWSCSSCRSQLPYVSARLLSSCQNSYCSPLTNNRFWVLSQPSHLTDSFHFVLKYFHLVLYSSCCLRLRTSPKSKGAEGCGCWNQLHHFILERHTGGIWIQSLLDPLPGCGSTHIIIIPVKDSCNFTFLFDNFSCSRRWPEVPRGVWSFTQLHH